MLKKTITYVDYNDVERTEDFFFNLSKSEIIEMELGTSGGLSERLQSMVSSLDGPAIVDMFRTLILKAYGEKSTDGKRFIKSEELSVAFSQTEAYSNLFTELTTDENAVLEFVSGILPKDLSDQISAEEAKAKAMELAGGYIE